MKRSGVSATATRSRGAPTSGEEAVGRMGARPCCPRGARVPCRRHPRPVQGASVRRTPDHAAAVCPVSPRSRRVGSGHRWTSGTLLSEEGPLHPPGPCRVVEAASDGRAPVRGGRRGWTPGGGHIRGAVSSRLCHTALAVCSASAGCTNRAENGATLSLRPDRGPVSPETTTFGLETWFLEKAQGRQLAERPPACPVGLAAGPWEGRSSSPPHDCSRAQTPTAVQWPTRPWRAQQQAVLGDRRTTHVGLAADGRLQGLPAQPQRSPGSGTLLSWQCPSMCGGRAAATPTCQRGARLKPANHSVGSAGSGDRPVTATGHRPGLRWTCGLGGGLPQAELRLRGREPRAQHSGSRGTRDEGDGVAEAWPQRRLELGLALGVPPPRPTHRPVRLLSTHRSVCNVFRL